jgi:hypothetical protein
MRFFNRRENPNAIVGLFLLILLAVFAGPNTLPQLIASIVPVADEGIPCSWLREGTGRATSQSLIGRNVSSRSDPPISLSVRTSTITGDPNQRFAITVVVVNDTLGTIPILVTPDSLILDPAQAASGLGVVINSEAPVPQTGENVSSYPETRIRLLGPRQRCVHRVEYTLSDFPNVSAIAFGGATIKAFYRNTVSGTATATPGNPTIYTDQGLWTGVVESPLRTIPVAGQ